MKKIIAIIVICLTIFGSCYYASKNFNKAEHSISVQWDGEVYVVPDTLILSFRVEETAPTTAEAQKNANEKIDKVKEIIKQYDVENTDIKTTNANVYEQYDWRDTGRVAQVSEIGGVLLNNISYDIFDKAPFYKEARKLAMEKAHQKASDLAEYGNVKLWDPISIIENRSYDYAVSTANYAMAKMAYDDAVEEAEVWWWAIELWEMKLTLDVSVVYAIK